MANEYIGKQFHIQLQGYLEKLRQKNAILSSAFGISHEIGVEVTRDQIESMAEGTCAPVEGFVGAFGSYLLRNGIVDAHGQKDFVQAASSAARFLEMATPAMSWEEIRRDDARLRAEALAARVHLESRKLQNPGGSTNAASFSEMLERHFIAGSPFNTFLDGVLNEWSLSPEKLAEFISQKSDADKNEAISGATIRGWWSKAKKPSPPSVKVLCAVFDLEPREEKRLYKMIHGFNIQPDALAQMIEGARQTGQTGELVTTLYNSSGIGAERLAEIIGDISIGAIYGWMNGDKVLRPDVAKKFIEAICPADLFSDVPDKRILQQQKELLGLLVLDKTKPLVVDKARSFEEILQDSFSKRQNWSEFLKNVLQSMKISPEQLCTLIEKTAKEKGLKGEYTLTNAIIYYWINHPEGHKPRTASIEIFRDVFGLDDTQERQMWKISSGRFLEKEELEKWLDKAEAARPLIAQREAELAALKSGGIKSLRVVAKAERNLREAEEACSGALVANLVDMSGISDTRLRDVLGTQQIVIWKGGTHIASNEMAWSFMEKTLEAERAIGNPSITKENENRLYRLITGRPMTVEQVLTENDHTQWTSNLLITALTGRKGIKTMTDDELADVIGAEKTEVSEIKRGRRLMDEGQREKLFAALGCEDEYAKGVANQILDRKIPRTPRNQGRGHSGNRY